jgi:hypothetical protein
MRSGFLISANGPAFTAPGSPVKLNTVTKSNDSSDTRPVLPDSCELPEEQPVKDT